MFSPLMGFNRLNVYCLITLRSVNDNKGSFYQLGKAVKPTKIKLKVQNFCLRLFVVSSRSNFLTFRPVRHSDTEPWLCAYAHVSASLLFKDTFYMYNLFYVKFTTKL